jgi:adenosylmethionine-8-amino-7-oxononanoate aminotransferase
MRCTLPYDRAETVFRMKAFDIGSVDAAHVWHPYTQHGIAPLPVPIVRADGAWLFDSDGRAILDAISSWWVTLHGHAQAHIAGSIARQAMELEQVIFAGMTHEPAARLALELVRRAPAGLDRVFFSDNGSTAVEVAVKMAVQFWHNGGENRRRIVMLEHAYHGDTFGAMSVSARSTFTHAFDGLLFDVEVLPHPSGGDTVSAFEAVLDAHGRDIAAIIVEPILQGAGGMRFWSPEVLRSLRTLAQQATIPFIADEVLTGFGRTGPLFACEHARIAPDIMCLSKGLTGGFLPLGATLATSYIFERFRSRDRSHTFFHGHSYTANPLACAAAIASLELLDEQSTAQRERIAASHARAVENFARMSTVRNVRALGTVFAFEIDAGANDYLNPVGGDLHAFALQRGVLLRPLGNTVYVLPPYCTADVDLARVYDVIEAFLARDAVAA